MEFLENWHNLRGFSNFITQFQGLKHSSSVLENIHAVNSNEIKKTRWKIVRLWAKTQLRFEFLDDKKIRMETWF